MSKKLKIFSHKLAKRWPYKLLNYFPATWKSCYLKKKSSEPALEEEALSYRQTFSRMRRGLIFMPCDLTTVILSIPLVEFTHQLSGKMQISLICLPDFKGILKGFFPETEIVSIDSSLYYLGETYFNELCEKIKSLQPEFTMELVSDPHPLNLYLQKISGARIRLGMGEENYPFMNITFSSSPLTNVFALYHKIAALWRNIRQEELSGLINIYPDPAYSTEINREITQAGLREKDFILFLWDERPELQTEQNYFINRLIQIRNSKLVSDMKLALAFREIDTKNITLPHYFSGKIPCFLHLSYGKMIALLSQSGLIMGFNTPVLHLANFCQQNIIGLFKEEDAPFNTSFAFPRFKVFNFQKVQELDIEQIMSQVRNLRPEPESF
jgi:hypothetical protein